MLIQRRLGGTNFDATGSGGGGLTEAQVNALIAAHVNTHTEAEIIALINTHDTTRTNAEIEALIAQNDTFRTDAEINALLDEAFGERVTDLEEFDASLILELEEFLNREDTVDFLLVPQPIKIGVTPSEVPESDVQLGDPIVQMTLTPEPTNITLTTASVDLDVISQNTVTLPAIPSALNWQYKLPNGSYQNTTVGTHTFEEDVVIRLVVTGSGNIVSSQTNQDGWKASGGVKVYSGSNDVIQNHTGTYSLKQEDGPHTLELPVEPAQVVYHFQMVGGADWYLQIRQNGSSTWNTATGNYWSSVAHGTTYQIRAVDTATGAQITNNATSGKKLKQITIIFSDGSTASGARVGSGGIYNHTASAPISSISADIVEGSKSTATWDSATHFNSGVRLPNKYKGWVRVTISGWHSRGRIDSSIYDAFYNHGKTVPTLTEAVGGLRGDMRAAQEKSTWPESNDIPWTSRVIERRSDANISNGRFRIQVKNGSSAWTSARKVSGGYVPNSYDQYLSHGHLVGGSNPDARKYKTSTDAVPLPSLTCGATGHAQWSDTGNLRQDAEAAYADSAYNARTSWSRVVNEITNDWDGDGTADHRTPQRGDHEYTVDIFVGTNLEELWFRPWNWDSTELNDRHITGKYFIDVQTITAKDGTVVDNPNLYEEIPN